MKESPVDSKSQSLSAIVTLWDSLHKTPRYSDTGFPMIRVTDLRRGYLDTSGALRVTEEVFKEFTKRYRPRVGDIILSRVGSYGISSFVNSDDPFCLGQNTVCISADRDHADPYFVYSFLNSPQAMSQIESFVGGASQPTISLKSIGAIQVPSVPLSRQQTISKTLRAYDDLIDNNTRRIAILEEMARRIYEEWFVRFRFPGHENARMVESELGLVPEDWRIQGLGELISFQKGRKPSQVARLPAIGLVPMLLIDALRGGPVEYAAPEKLLLVAESDTIMVMDGSGSGEVFIGHEGAIGSTLGRYRSENRHLGAFYLFLLFSTRKDEIRAKNIGAAIPHANKDYISSIGVAVPPHSVAQQFEELVAPMFTLRRSLRLKNANLRTTRDLLLPKLISGELDVPAMPDPEAAAA